MSDLNAGTARAAYLLDISSVEQGAAKIRALLNGIRQQEDALHRGAPLGAPSTPIAAPGNESAAALSRQALAAGDAAGALDLMNQALGKTTEQERANTTATEASARSQAALRIALGDRIGAIELLEAAHARQAEGSAEEVAIARQLAQIENQGLATKQRDADATIRLAQEQARAALAVKDYTAALEILNGVQTEGASAQVVAALETQIATTERAGTVTGALGGQLSALVNPTTLVIAGLGVATKAVQSFSEAVDFVGKLQDARTAFGGILGDFDKGNAVLDTAAKRTRQFGLTEEETTQAFRELAPVIRESTATTNQQAEALARFAVIHPEDPVNALKTAAEGLATGGRITQIAKDLDLTVGEQARLKQAAAEGGDVFVLLNNILDKHGITLDVAAKRMDGLAGATRREQIAAQDLKKAQGNFAAGPGIAITNEEVRLLNDTTNLLNGNFSRFVTDNGPGFVKAITDVPTVLGPITGTISRYNSAVLDLGGSLLGLNAPTAQASAATSRLKDDFYDAVAAERAIFAASTRVGGAFDDERRAAAQLQVQTGLGISDIQRSAEASDLDAAKKAVQEAANRKVADQNRLTTDSFLALNPNMDASGAIAAAAAQGYPVLIGQLAALRIQLQGATNDQIALNNAENAKTVTKTLTTERFAGRSGGRGDSSDAQADADAFVAGVKVQTAATEKTIDAQIALAAAHKDTAKQIDLLRQKANLFGKDEADRVQIQAQIISLQTSAGKTRVSAAQSTGLQLAQTEATSQAAILKAQREGQERLRDSEQDFLLHRSRSQEDEAIKIRDLLAHGQRAQAQKERENFAREQTRAQEDFNIQRQRTVRNNAESTGDIDARTDLRQQQIGQRAALRGVRPVGGASASGIPAPPLPIPTAPAAGTQPIIIRFQPPPANIQINGETLVTVSWPFFEQRIDAELASELSTIGIVLPPGGGQAAVAGARP